MTSLGNLDLAISDQAKSVVEMASKHGGFGNELSLEVSETGTWIVKIFSCYDSECSIEIRITETGYVSVSRTIVDNGIKEERKISF